MKKKVWKLSLFLVLLLSLSILAVGCGGKGAADKSSEKKLKDVTAYGVIDAQVSAQQIIADKKGFFKEEGLNVTNKLVQSGTEIGPMIAGGTAKFSFESNYTDISLASNNVPVVILAPVANIGGTQSIVARPGLNIKSAKDLEGKKIGMASGSGVLLAIRKMGKELGVDVNKITFVNLQPADQVAAIEKGDIDAMAAWEPWVTKATKLGGKFLFSGSKADLPEKKGDVNWMNFHTTIQVTKDVIDKDPETVKAFLRAAKKATDFINNNPDEAAEILAKELKLDKTELKEMMSRNVYSMDIDDRFVQGTDEIADYMLELKNIKTKPDFKTYTDFSMLKAVDPSLIKVK